MSIILRNVSSEVFSNVSLDLKKDEKIGIIGENGVGKTTLLRTILGLIKSQGEIKLFSNECKKRADYKEVYPRIGYLFQESEDSFIASSVLEEVAFNLYNITEDLEKSEEEALKILQEFQIEHLRDELPIKLSGGQKRAVSICACLAHNPDILLLDEPTNHLDKSFVSLVKRKLQNFNGAIILVAHNIEFAKEIVDSFYELKKDGLEKIEVENEKI